MNEIPYRLFDFYRYEDRHLFFGRDEEVARMVQDILSTRLLVLFAPSGSGKSSLLRAGVRPALEKRGCDCVFTRIGEDPVDAVVQAMASLDSAGAGNRTDVDSSPKESKRGLVVFIDQFEELFTHFSHDSQKRAAFAQKLAEAFFDQSLRVYFVLSLRSEYFVSLNEFRDAIPSIFHNNANLELLPFDASAARRAIVGPSEVEGSSFEWEPGLAETIIEDLQDARVNPNGNGVLPITLQMVCHTLWSQLPGGRGRITRASYARVGGAKGIVDNRILQTLNAIPAGDRRLLCRMLRELMTKDGLKRIQPLARLQKAIGQRHAARLDKLLQLLQSDLLLSRESARDDVWIELRHDYLASRIKPWVETEERQLDAKRLRLTLIGSITLALVSAVGVWLWIGYHTYSGVLGADGHTPSPADELVVSSKLGKFRIGTGWTRPLLQMGDIEWDTFDVPDARTDWHAVGIRLAQPARARFSLATELDGVDSSAGLGHQEKAVGPNVDSIAFFDIGYYVAADDKVFKFIMLTLQKGNPEAKRSAAFALSGLAGGLSSNRRDAVLDALMIGLADPVPLVREAAMDAIGRLAESIPPGRSEAIANALLGLLRLPDYRMKTHAIQALVRLGSQLPADRLGEVSAGIVDVLKYRNDESVRASIGFDELFMTLSQDRSGTVIKALLNAFHDDNASFDYFPTWMIGQIGARLPAGERTAIADVFLASLQGRNDSKSRLAASALGSFGEGLPDDRAGAVTDALIAGINRAHSRIKLDSIASLGSLGKGIPADRRAIVTDTLLAVLRNPDSYGREEAAIALLDLLESVVPLDRIDTVFNALLIEPKDVDRLELGSARFNTVLSSLGNRLSADRARPVADWLLAALENTDLRIRRNALLIYRVFARKTPPDRLDAAAGGLLAAFNAAGTRRLAASALLGLGPVVPAGRRDGVVDAMLVELKNADSAYRYVAAVILGELGPAMTEDRRVGITEALLAAFKEADSDIKASIATALGNLGPTIASQRRAAVIEALLAAVNDSDRSVGSTSAIALSRLGSDMNESTMEQALFRIGVLVTQSDPDQGNLITLLTAIRKLTKEPAIPPTAALLSALESDESRKRSTAVHALPRRQLSAAQIDRIRTLRDDPDRRPWVRMAALDTLMEIEREKVLASAPESPTETR